MKLLFMGLLMISFNRKTNATIKYETMSGKNISVNAFSIEFALH